MSKEEKSGSEILSTILTEMNEEGGFPISILTDKEGLPIAWAASDGTDPDRQSAVVAFVQKTSLQVSKQLGLTDVDEVSFCYANGQHLVCRPFIVDNNIMTLAIIVTRRDQRYRRATNRAMTEIRNTWKIYWDSTL